ncbi:putative histamine H2 receptor-like [Scophthalmus maximus]|uniref:Putative histamine H2 receptor-like n=1 Tax=Scophthalmus maximus TaxID=52904 RepID=A0A2U9BC75_SCOMX|nr:putative histamine H2 receptor-like [Scophthalmus maximus]
MFVPRAEGLFHNVGLLLICSRPCLCEQEEGRRRKTEMYSALNLSTWDDANLSALRPRGPQELAHRSVKVSVIVALGVIITLGNVAVLLVITSSVAGWSRNSRYFLLSLTAADSAFGLLVMPLNLWVSLLKDYAEGPDALCHAVAFCNATVHSTCMYTLATISLERYVAVFYPLQYSRVLTRRRALLLIAFAWCFPPCLLAPISFPGGIIEVHFSTASLVCNPAYSTNAGYSLSLTCFIFFPCSVVMTFANLRVWRAAKRQRLKLRKYERARRRRHNAASRVLVPVMAAYYTCWTPCMAAMIYNAVSGSSVPEWMEFVVVWLPTSNGFLNCIFYFWINRSFRRKFHLVLQRATLALCPKLAETLGCRGSSNAQFVSGFLDNNNSVYERSSSVSSTCTLLSLA